jgi:hypothetical protein
MGGQVAVATTKVLNYTTKIPVKKTVGECTELLAEAGATRVAIVYDHKVPVGLSFRLEVPQSGWQDFTLPVNVAAMARRLAGMKLPPSLHASAAEERRIRSTEHAAEVAWRVVEDWLEAQLAIIAAEMATLDQVMLPYLQLADGTLYEVIRDQHLALPAA